MKFKPQTCTFSSACNKVKILSEPTYQPPGICYCHTISIFYKSFYDDVDHDDDGDDGGNACEYNLILINFLCWKQSEWLA